MIARLLQTAPVTAHSSVEAHGVETVVHVTPDDAPIAGEQSEVTVQVMMEGEPLSIAECECVAEILSNNTVVTTFTILSTVHPVRFNYIFPIPGSYTIRFSGKPKTSAAHFEPFVVEHPVTVHSNVIPGPLSRMNWDAAAAVVFAIGGVGLVGLSVVRYWKR